MFVLSCVCPVDTRAHMHTGVVFAPTDVLHPYVCVRLGHCHGGEPPDSPVLALHRSHPHVLQVGLS